jgi:hypothetical protein
MQGTTETTNEIPLPALVAATALIGRTLWLVMNPKLV